LHSLAFPRQRLSLALQGPHHAVGDAEATWRTLREQVECLLLRPAEHLQEWAEWTENQTLRDFLAKVGLCQPLARKLLPGDEKETEARSQPATDLPVTLVIAPQVAWRPYFDRAYTQCWQPGKAAPLCNALAYICPQAVRARLRKGKTPDIGLYLDAFLKDAEAQHFSNAEVTLPPWPAHWFREAIEGGEIAEVRRDCTVCDQTTCPFHVAQARTLVADYRTATCLPDGFVPQEVIVDRPYQALTDVEEPVPLAVERSDLPVTVCDKLTARGLVRIPLTLEEVNSLILNGKEGMRYWLETGLPGREERLRIISSPTDPWQRACNEITFPNQCLGSGEIV
jgi:hypothetical protein